ncbi:MAG: DUF2333 family protein [Xanthomonadales bacterium]|nr:DUF2333 family protein [Xanthomonadales bacterium]
MSFARRIREFFLLADLKRLVLIIIPGALALLMLILMFYYDTVPPQFDVRANARQQAAAHGHEVVTGYITVATLQRVASSLWDKRGGYLSNDVTPPSVIMDNVPNWEWGVLRQVRDLSRVLRYDMSRSQSQSTEDEDLQIADPKFNVDSETWLFPRPESEYAEAVEALGRYADRLTDPQEPSAQFYARADNLRDALAVMGMQLGSLANRLNASVGPSRVNTDLSGDPAAEQSTSAPSELRVKTPWLQIDDVFWEARGSCWALLHFLKAIEIDFESVLEKKNARASLRQIIRDLESTQARVWSPLILNGRGFAFTANHSLVMASYISQANAAMIDLRNLLEQG